MLVRRSLEATVAELGAGVDELQLDVLEGLTLGVHQQGLEKEERDQRTVGRTSHRTIYLLSTKRK